jgi:RHS repeat-associated protein
VGGKLVGMRRVNQADGQNGQYRIAGDHLGSTTLIVDTSGPPQIVQRQYHKPYGEVAWQYTSGGSSLTSINFTGQRLDADSGLMYYGARFYDPILSHFVSPDIAAPDKTDLLSRHRYSYVQNNPVRYNDPTGHTPEDPQGDRDDAAAKRQYEDELGKLGVNLEGPWKTWELRLLLGAIKDLMKAAKWDTDDFKNAMGGSINFIRMEKPTGISGWGAPENLPAHAYNTPFTGNVIEMFNTAFTGSDADIKGTIVHELAHAWDSTCGYCLTRQLVKETGGKYEVVVADYTGGNALGTQVRYVPGETPTSLYGYEGGDLEDFAESVKATVYPELFGKDSRWPHTLKESEHRLNVVKGQFEAYRR